jgi:hypothetical protein
MPSASNLFHAECNVEHKICYLCLCFFCNLKTTNCFLRLPRLCNHSRNSKLSLRLNIALHILRWMCSLFMSMGWDYVSKLQPPPALLLIRQVIYEYREKGWNDSDRGNRRTLKRTYPRATLSTTDPTWTDSDANPVGPLWWEAGD